MAGVTNSAFRSLCRSYGAGLYVSEMVSARALVEGSEKTRRMLTFGPDEDLHSIQLYGVDPDVIGRSVTMLRRRTTASTTSTSTWAVRCPKVTKLGGGAALPLHGVLFAAIVGAAVRAAGAVPVTVKMRMGIDDRHDDLHQRRPDRGRPGRGRRRAARPHRRAALLRHGRLVGHRAPEVRA